MMASPANRLLIVDDEPRFCAFVENAAATLGYSSRSLTDASLFLSTFEEFQPSVLIIDLRMPGCDGIQILQTLKWMSCSAKIVLVSGMDRRVLGTAEKLGRSYGLDVVGALEKPVKLQLLQSVLTDVVRGSRRFTREELEHALENDGLIVQYQPKIHRVKGRWDIKGGEALVRWMHPRLGLIAPDRFLGAAENLGLIGALTDHVLETCLCQIVAWDRQGLDLSLAVNLSAKSMIDSEFPDRVVARLRKHGVAGERLTLEVTESAAMADPTKAMDILLRLRVAGVGLAIDDFGTGFSSLKQLYQLPFDELKIDRTFVRDLPGDEEARTIVRATVEMAHALRMTVCAEGVESRGALEYLESIDCDQAQGFLVSRPVSGPEFEQLVGRWGAQMLHRAVR